MCRTAQKTIASAMIFPGCHGRLSPEATTAVLDGHAAPRHGRLAFGSNPDVHRDGTRHSALGLRALAALRLSISCCLAVCSVFAAAAAGGESWPQFRGPGGDGRTGATGLALTWSEAEHVTWKTALPGRAWSSPVVADGGVWLTNAPADGAHLRAVCVDAATGKVLHDVKVFDVAKPLELNKLNSHASPTPVLADGKVWVHFGSYGTACLDARTAKVIWSRRDLKCDHAVGPGSSPILVDDKLVCNFDGMDVQFVIALDRATGKTVWKTPRGTQFGNLVGDMRKAFSTPAVLEVGGRRQIVSTGAGAAYAYQPDTGKKIWSVRYPKGFSTVGKPILAGGMVIVNSGFSRPRVMAIRPGGTGDITDTHVAWTITRDTPIKPSPAAVDGLLYLVTDRGVLTCTDAATGKQVWRERVGGTFSASPLVAPGRLYFFDERGTCTVIQPGRTFRRLAANKLDDGCMASPAVIGHAMFVRTKTHLYRIEN